MNCFDIMREFLYSMIVCYKNYFLWYVVTYTYFPISTVARADLP